jgi:hypothetical protein
MHGVTEKSEMRDREGDEKGAAKVVNRVFQTSLFGAQLGRNLSPNFIPT